MPNNGVNYAVAQPTFARAMRNIFSIVKGTTTSITTTLNGLNPGDHNYSSGLIVRIIVPHGLGMDQINQMQGTITVTSSSTFIIDINSSTFDDFSIPAVNPGHFYTPAQVIPIGEINSILTQATQNVLPYP